MHTREEHIGSLESSVDFVVTWVDDTDKLWQKKQASYKCMDGKNNDYSNQRYRNWDTLKYWFRAVDMYAPWVRRIYLVTDHQLPAWLNINNKKINIVYHEDIIPKEFLPTFNSNAIELCLHRIKGLSNTFVYFNDDVFLTAPVKKSNYFRKGLPCDMLAMQPVVANPANPFMTHIFQNNALILSKHFNKREIIKRNTSKYFNFRYPLKYNAYNLIESAYPLFTGFFSAHSAMPLLKSTYKKVWKAEEAALEQTLKNRFRSDSDISVYLIREWQKLSGCFIPVNINKGFEYYELNDNFPVLVQEFNKKLYRTRINTICINDSGNINDSASVKASLSRCLHKKYNKPCQFEI